MGLGLKESYSVMNTKVKNIWYY